jgi:predicted PurR-regulated permease PerM
MDRYLPKLSEPAARWVRFGGLLLAIAGLGWLVLRLQTVLTPIAAALAIAYMLNPVVTALERRRVSRITSVSVALILLLIVGVVLLMVGGAQLLQLAERIPGYFNAAQGWLAANFPSLFPEEGLEREKVLEQIKEHGTALARAVFDFGGNLLSNVMYWLTLTVLVPMYTFFFLWRFNDVVRAARDHLPGAYRPTIVHVVTTIDRAIATFFRGRLVVSLVVGVLTGILWLIIGVPLAPLLGAAAGVLNLVPFLSVLALPPALLLTYLDAAEAGANWVQPVVLVMAAYMFVQALESFVLTPYVESKSSGMHPVTTVVALLIGGELAGLLGMLLSIPIASTLKSLGAEYLLPEIRRLAAPARDGPEGDSSTRGAAQDDST